MRRTIGVLLLAAATAAETEEASGLRVSHGWPQLPEGTTLGEVSGLGVDSHGNVVVFHRGHRPWMDDATKAGPIPEATLVVLDGRTGKQLAGWGQGLFLLPHGLFVDRQDNVWVTDVGRHQVMEFTHDGRLLREWGERGVPGDDPSHFDKPTDVAVGADGSFYVSDGYGNSRVAKFSAEGKFLLQWGKKGTAPGEFDLPHGIALDAEGRVYVADRQNDRIQIFTGEGKLLGQWKSAAMGRPYGVRVARDGRVYVADGGEQPEAPPDRSKVVVLDSAGKVLESFGRWGNYDGQFMIAHDIAVGPDGSVYVGDILGRRVQKLERATSR
jgi:DNA-binding beta-propeller fold protein YncE